MRVVKDFGTVLLVECGGEEFFFPNTPDLKRDLMKYSPKILSEGYFGSSIGESVITSKFYYTKSNEPFFDVGCGKLTPEGFEPYHNFEVALKKSGVPVDEIGRLYIFGNNTIVFEIGSVIVPCDVALGVDYSGYAKVEGNKICIKNRCKHIIDLKYFRGPIIFKDNSFLTRNFVGNARNYGPYVAYTAELPKDVLAVFSLKKGKNAKEVEGIALMTDGSVRKWLRGKVL